MKILITGSFRLGEAFGFRPNSDILFQHQACQLGRSVAKHGHNLLMTWSQHNLPSQLGQKNEILQGRNHPYTETADYFALLGFLSETQEVGLVADTAGSITLLVSGPDCEHVTPFPNLPRPAYEALQKFNECGRLTQEFVEDREPLLRSHLLKLASSKADAVIAIGGGKATTGLITDPILRMKLLPATGVGGASERHARNLSSFAAAAGKTFSTEQDEYVDLSSENLARLMKAVSQDLSAAPRI
jgi:hypothetical protein